MQYPTPRPPVPQFPVSRREKIVSEGPLRLVMILHLVGGILTAILGICAALLFLSNARNAANVVSPIAIYVLAFGVLMYAFSPLVSAWLIGWRVWRWFSVLVSLLYAPLIPFGTAISIYSLWVLLSPEMRYLYQRRVDAFP